VGGGQLSDAKRDPIGAKHQGAKREPDRAKHQKRSDRFGENVDSRGDHPACPRFVASLLLNGAGTHTKRLTGTGIRVRTRDGSFRNYLVVLRMPGKKTERCATAISVPL